MKPADFFKLFDRIHSDRRKLLDSKSADYATEDVLSNFKRMSGLCRLLNIDTNHPAGCCLFLLTLKLDRICNVVFRKGEDFTNEKLDDSIADLLNYANLLHGILGEGKDMSEKIGIGKETVIAQNIYKHSHGCPPGTNGGMNVTVDDFKMISNKQFEIMRDKSARSILKKFKIPWLKIKPSGGIVTHEKIIRPEDLPLRRGEKLIKTGRKK